MFYICNRVMSINSRVVQLIDKTAGSKSSFSKATGISNVILSHISSGRNKVSLTAVEQILTSYPDVNAEWLILGKGSMFKQGPELSKEADLLRIIEEMTKGHLNAKKLFDRNIAQLRSILSS